MGDQPLPADRLAAICRGLPAEALLHDELPPKLIITRPDKPAPPNDQLTVLYCNNTGQRENGLELHHLVKTKNPKLVIIPLPPMSEHQQSRLFSMIAGYQSGLDRRDFISSPGMHCSFCEFFNDAELALKVRQLSPDGPGIDLGPRIAAPVATKGQLIFTVGWPFHLQQKGHTMKLTILFVRLMAAH